MEESSVQLNGASCKVKIYMRMQLLKVSLQSIPTAITLLVTAIGVWLQPLHAGEVQSIWHDSDMVTEGRISPDGKLAFTFDGFTILLWESATGKVVRRVNVSSLFSEKWPSIHGVAPSPSLAQVAVSSNGKVSLFDLQRSQMIWVTETNINAKKLVWSEDGRFLVVAADYSKSATVLDARSGAVVSMLDLLAVPTGSEPAYTATSLESIAISPDATTIFLGGSNEGGLYSRTSGKPLLRIRRDGIFIGASFSPDGKRLATAMSDNEVCLWGRNTGEQLRCLDGHKNLVTDVAFSPDGSTIASAGYEGEILISEVESGKPVTTLSGHQGGVYGLDYSPDGKHLLSVGGDSTGRFWSIDGDTGADAPVPLEREKQVIKPSLVAQLGHSGGVTASAISADGNLVVTGGADGVVSINEASSGRVIRRISAHPGNLGKINVLQLAFDDSVVITGSDDGTVGLWEIETGRKRLQINVDTQVDALAVVDDGKLIVTASEDGGFITAWSGLTGEKIRRVGEILDRDQGVFGIALLPDNRRFSSAHRDGKVRIYDFKSGVVQRTLEIAQNNIIYRIAVTPDGKRIVTTTLNREASVWDLESGTQLHQWNFEDKQIWSSAVSPDGHTVAFGDNSGETHILNLESGNEIRTLPKIKGAQGGGLGVHTLSFAPNSPHLVVGTGGTSEAQGVAQLWQLGDESMLQEYSGQSGAVVSASFSPNGDFVLVNGLTEAVFWDLRTGGVVGRLAHPLRKRVKFVSGESRVVSPDGNNVVVRSLHSGQQGRLIPSEGSFDFRMVHDVVSSPDGQHLLTNELDGLFLRDADSGRVIHHFPDVTLGFAGAEPLFSPDGKAVFTLTHDEGILWDVESGKPRSRISQPGAFINFDKMAFTANGRYVVIRNSSHDEAIVLDMEQGQIARRYPESDKRYRSDSYWLLAAPDGGVVLLNATYDGSYRLIDPVSSKEQLRWADSPGYITTAALSPDGNLLATSGEDRSVSLWDVSDGQLITRLDHHSGSVNEISFSTDGERMLSASSDGSVGIWDLSKNRLLASLLSFSNGDWAVVAADGRYVSNAPGDLPALSWVMPDEPLKPLPIEIFLREYFEPRLLVRLFGGEAMTPVQLVSEVNRLQPLTRITSITASSADPASVDISVEVKSVSSGEKRYSGARDLRIFRDGQLIAYGLESDDEQLKQEGVAELRFKDVRIPTDRNSDIKFSAYAFNHDGVKGVSSHYPFKPQLSSEKRAPRAYVVSIGVNSHQNSAWDLSYSAADARAMQSVLIDRLRRIGRYETVVPIALISDRETGESSARKEVVSAVLAALAGDRLDQRLLDQYPQLATLRSANPEDTLILSFSGHGYADENGVFHLFPEDIGVGTRREVTDAMLKRTISGNELSRWLRDVDAGEMVMIIDACNSAASVESDGFKPGPMGSRGFGQLAFNKGMRILTATQAENVALESDLIGHGIMTYALLREGLEQTRADAAPLDGEIKVGEWLIYGVARVPDLYHEVKRGRISGTRGVVRVHKPSQTEQAARRLNVQRPGLFDFVKSRSDQLIERYPVQSSRDSELPLVHVQ